MRLSEFVSRCAALTLAAAAVGGLWLILLQPLIDSLLQHRQSIRQSQAALAKYQNLGASRAQHPNLQQPKTAQDKEDRLLSGASPQLAGANLQNHLKELIEENRGRLSSMQMLPVREEEGLQRISLAISLGASIQSLQPILYAVEYQRPYMFIENLELRSNSGTFEVRDAAEQSASEEIQVQMEVYGYLPTRVK
jgi:general secretion pathway protein M